MGLNLVRAKPEHVSELGRICYEAFKGIQEGRQSPLDWPNVDIARRVFSMLVKRKDFYSVVALLDGRPVGSNFLSLMDPVAGVGPITVDPPKQGKDIGRALMQVVLDYAVRNNIKRVRLLQDAFNVASLSLYASLGFNVREPIAVMQAAPAPNPDDSVRPVKKSDLLAIGLLSKSIYKTSRRGEAASSIRHGIPTFVRERNGRVTGYLTPGMLGHGVAETEDDMIALIGASAHFLVPDSSSVFVPLRESSLCRKVLKAGCRAIKIMNLMSLGPYEPPDGVWMPSVLY